MEEIIELLRTKFFNEINSKTGWGKNEIRLAFEVALNATLLEIVTEQLKDNDETF